MKILFEGVAQKIALWFLPARTEKEQRRNRKKIGMYGGTARSEELLLLLFIT